MKGNQRARRVVLACTASVGLLVASSLGASASSAHFKKGSPRFTDNGLTLTEAVQLAGLGNGDLVVSLTATGIPTAVCTNPAGNTQPPGQNPAVVTVGSGAVSIPSSQIKNGNVSFDVTTLAPPTTIVPPACPNSQWTETITNVAFTAATLSVNQGGQAVSLAGSSCTFAPKTADGSVPGATVSCS